MTLSNPVEQPVQPTELDVETSSGSGAIRPHPVMFVSGKGARLTTADGTSYIDANSSYGVTSLGHAHPVLLDAIHVQSSRLMALTPTFQNDVRAAYMRALLDAVAPELDRVFLCNSGTEAIEAALKIARVQTGRFGVVGCVRGFHGRTLGALSVTAEKAYRAPFAPLLDGVQHVPYGRIEALSQAVDETTSAVVVEVIQGEGGVRMAPEGYLREVRELCDSTGALLVLDEVQTGFGRTGTLFAHEREGVVPDVLALAKGIAGGFPMGAAVFRDGRGALPRGSHGSTFGGNPLACAAALATLQTLRDERLPERAEALGEAAMSRLRAGASSNVREVRGRGLMIGIELRTAAAPALQALLERRIVALTAGRNVLRLLPPLVIEEEDLEQVIDAVLEVTA